METTAERVTAVLRLANEVHALAGRYGRADLAEPLAQAAARWKEDETTIVVAGAQKRGKSRLINTLVGRPGLLPVDADIATDCHLRVRRGENLTAVVHDQLADDVPIDPEHLADYASVAGDPARRRTVLSVDVTVPSPLLDGVCLVDTPGVDSLTVGHRQVTMAMLRRADALLFVLSAQDQPVLRHELEFLAETVQRIPAVAFVLTKVEDSANWRDLLEENRRRLETFVRESGDALRPLLDAPWFPVSAKLGEAAAAQLALGRAERAEALRTRSGMGRLEAYLRGCARDRALTRSATVLSAARSVLAALAASAEDHDAASSPGRAAERLAVVEQALEDLAATARRRRLHGAANQFLGQEIATLVRTQLAQVRAPYDRAIAELDTRSKLDRYLAELSDSVERSLQAAWEGALDEVTALVSGTLNDFLTSLGLDPMEVDLARATMPATLPRNLTVNTPPPQRFDLFREGVPAATMAASIGLMLAHLTPLGLLVGPVLAAEVLRRRRAWEQVHRDQAALRNLLAEQFAQAATALTLALQREAAAWRATVEQAADEALAKQRKELEARRAELKSLIAGSGGRSAQEPAGERLTRIAALARQAETLRAEIAADINALGDGATG
ncbi:dynamin family protein [Thermopolyspora sp. NPDC052614]|uniref:dynamin family protein n=1 Tax=Thermopolyspora sp. NPDC052614 TaxID=3155682 RepID=UPI00343CF9DE